MSHQHDGVAAQQLGQTARELAGGEGRHGGPARGRQLPQHVRQDRRRPTTPPGCTQRERREARGIRGKRGRTCAG